MITSFTERAWLDYLHWQESDPDLLDKVNSLIRDIKRDPFRGLGKPEPLKENLKGYWSRRISDEHRLVYRVFGEKGDQTLRIITAGFHY